MSSVYKLKGLEISVASANTVGSSNLVRVYNTSASDAVLTVAYANGTAYANCTLGTKQSIIIEKDYTDTVAGSGLNAVSIAYRN